MVFQNKHRSNHKTDIQIKSFDPTDIEAVDELQHAYTQTVPEGKIVPAGYYLSPAFHNGEDVFCAFSNGNLIAYAPAYVQITEGPLNLPHRVWIEIKAHPALPDPFSVKDLLLDCVLQRARQLVGEVDAVDGRSPTQVIFEYAVTETAAVRYAASRGFVYTESVFSMSRDLTNLLLPSHELSTAQVTLKRWKMETEAGQSAYIAARNLCFPESPIRLEQWQDFMQSPMWPAATMIAAFVEESLVGCVSVYWNDEQNRRSGIQAGFTEDIFVLPAWRGHGIAFALVADGLSYLKEHGLNEARLEVRTLNENALILYRRLGFRVTGESRFYARNL